MWRTSSKSRHGDLGKLPGTLETILTNTYIPVIQNVCQFNILKELKQKIMKLTLGIMTSLRNETYIISILYKVNKFEMKLRSYF